MTGVCASALVDEELMASAREKIELSARNKLWAMNNIGKLRLKYADKYIALKDEEVLAYGDSPDEVFEQLRKLRVSDLSTVAIEFIPKDLLIWLL